MKLVYEIFHTTYNPDQDHLGGAIVFSINNYTTGEGQAIFINNRGEMETEDMNGWECRYRNQIWRFFMVDDQDDEQEIDNTILPPGKQYVPTNDGIYKYITYTVKHIRPSVAGPGEGSGTAGNTGGNIP